MRVMFADAERRHKGDLVTLENKLDEIKRFQLHGVELQEKLFAVGTTNMILRGDGKANFQRNSIFDVTREGFFPADPTRPGRLDGFTKVLMNPPYSQSKDKTTRHLSELSFISYALDLLEVRGLTKKASALAHKMKHSPKADRTTTGITADAVILLANILRRLEDG